MQAQALTLPKIVVGLLLRPQATWRALQAAPRRRVWAPALAMALLAALLVFVSANADAAYRYQLALDWYAQQATGTPPTLQPLAFTTTALQAAHALGALALRWALWTGALLAAVRFFAGGRLTWRDALAVTLWGWLPLILRGLVQLAFVMLARTPVYNPGLSGLAYEATPPPLTAFRYVTPSAAQWAAAMLLRGGDLFALWQGLLTAWGFAAFTQTPVRKALALTAAVWAAALLLHLVLG